MGRQRDAGSLPLASRSSSSAAVLALPAEKQQGFGWERREDVWVMGALCESLIRKAALEPLDLSATRCPVEKPDEGARRQRCQCRTSGRDREGAALTCPCARYDPALMVPHSLLDRKEFARDCRGAARRALREAEWPQSVPEDLREEFVVDTLDTTSAGVSNMFCPRGGPTPGHLLCFRIRPERRDALLSALRRGSRAYVAEVAALDRAEFEANSLLLPHLHQYCNELREVKAKMLAHEEAEDASRDAFYKDFSGWARDTGLTAFDVDDRQQLTETCGRLGRARVLCRCGHADLWHEKPPARAGLLALTDRKNGLLALPAPCALTLPTPSGTPALASRSGTRTFGRAAAMHRSTSAPSAGISQSPSSVMLVAGRLVLERQQHEAAIPEERAIPDELVIPKEWAVVEEQPKTPPKQVQLPVSLASQILQPGGVRGRVRPSVLAKAVSEAPT